MGFRRSFLGSGASLFVTGVYIDGKDRMPVSYLKNRFELDRHVRAESPLLFETDQ